METVKEFIALKEFDQIRTLDNFDADIYLKTNGETKLSAFLSGILEQSKNNYVKRSCFKTLATLTVVGVIRNRFVVLSHLQNFLQEQDSQLKAAALKYVPFFPEVMTDDTLELIKELSDDGSADVSSEAYLALGSHWLSSSFSLSNGMATDRMNLAQVSFSSAITAIENRVDANHFLDITNFCKAILQNNIEVASGILSNLEESLLIANLYDFDGMGVGLELDIVLYKACRNLHGLLELTGASNRWIDVRASIEAVYQVNLDIWNAKDLQTKSLIISSRHWATWLSRLEEVVYRNNLGNERDRLKAVGQTVKDETLEKFVVKVLKCLPEIGTQEENGPLLSFLAEHFGSEKALASFGSLKNRNASQELLQMISGLLSKDAKSDLALRTGSVIGKEVFENVMSEVESLLNGYSSQRKQLFELVFEEVIRYARQSFVGNTKNRFGFLFSKQDGGKGDDALEHDLQDDMLLFFEHSKISSGLEHEKAKFVDGGRVDILYKTDTITIPIELKKAKHSLSAEEIESNYIAQAQTYAAGYDQLGLFVLLDLSDKSVSPPPNFRDWFRVHHLPTSSGMTLKYPDLVISVVIPGNRTLPSSKSTYD